MSGFRVPLKSIEVELEVRDHVATVVSTLNYENKKNKPLEAVVVFPLPGDAAVCHFNAKIGQTQIVAEVKEKQKAREEYDDALSFGQRAFLLEESDQSPDIFSLSVGSLPPGESASIRLEYVTELAVQADDGLRFCLPAVLNPRFNPQISGYEKHLTLAETLKFKHVKGHKFDRDVELLIYYKDAHQPTAVVEAGQASAEPGTLMGDPVVMVSLYPEFPQSVMSSGTSCGEFVFLMDRSGSMGYHKSVEYSQETMQEALKNVDHMEADLGGSGMLEPLKYIYNQPCIPSHPRQSIEVELKVRDHVATVVSTLNYENKEDKPSEAVFVFPLPGDAAVCHFSAKIRQTQIVAEVKEKQKLFVFTDGEVGNTKEVIDLVKKNSDSHRCFSFGIGEGASSALINGMAKEGEGHAQFITGTDRMQAKVMQSLRFALQPTVVDISVTWDLPKEVSVTVLSPPITALFQGQRSLIYAQLTGQSSEAAEGCVTVKYSLAGHPSENQLHFSLRPAEDTGLTVHRLGARTLIRSLELEERESRGQQDGEVKKKLVRLSVQSGVSSSFTAFIAVNKDNSRVIQGPLVRRNIPTPMTQRFGSVLLGHPRMSKYKAELLALEGTCVHGRLLHP
ncbi:von Willebrand factor A domain-containing protein 5A-like [Pundamilia nyererei]|uniref:von Willebrand factor A domain-containing protein 5A-like n=1 Tax=Pundamilia nyererei TaxID=303518 RepID=A0A9Y6JCB3_9CICH|nr:PREDICTED: von Willebrand factor A domain-containing protein 5A-like [Pundamilia nyererei]